mmetsp:Transcript_43618/g.144396  ORF Transcript_43618/g.144396 Transcript_43618/m.144396 type:complete len:233 (-) Transcript_43618:283-981(-)
MVRASTGRGLTWVAPPHATTPSAAPCPLAASRAVGCARSRRHGPALTHHTATSRRCCSAVRGSRRASTRRGVRRRASTRRGVRRGAADAGSRRRRAECAARRRCVAVKVRAPPHGASSSCRTRPRCQLLPLGSPPSPGASSTRRAPGSSDTPPLAARARPTGAARADPTPAAPGRGRWSTFTLRARRTVSSRVSSRPSSSRRCAATCSAVSRARLSSGWRGTTSAARTATTR